MSDINEIKELIEFSEIWFNDVEEGEPIAQDEIDLVKDLIAALKSHSTTIESQKEEIERNRLRIESYELGLQERDSSIESLKAITELAVKGLKMISRYPHYPDDSHSHSFQTVQREAVITLSEIEKLQNG